MKVYDLVKDVLERSPASRNSDKILMFEVWSDQGFLLDGAEFLYFDIDNWLDMAHPKSIIESRRNIQRDQEERILNNQLRSGETVVVADSKYAKLREQLASQKGTHVFRDEVRMF